MPRKSRALLLVTVVLAVAAGVWMWHPLSTTPPGNRSEPVTISRLPLPPTAPSHDAGACSVTVNPHATGCLDASDAGIIEGPSYLWDGHHVLLPVTFAGAPAAPAPANIYSGPQVIAIATDGTTFPDGDSWKCITCGVPAGNKLGVTPTVDHPQAFRDDKRAVIGTNILDCGTHVITDAACTPEATHIYPIMGDGSGAVAMRELRLNPDNVHLGYSDIFYDRAINGGITEFGAMGRLTFDNAPTTGTPLVPRYELGKISFMASKDPQKSGRFLSVDPAHPDQLRFDDPAGVIGELRGFTSDGKSALGIGTRDSWNYDIFATDLTTGKSTRLTHDPAYTDPAATSPDDKTLADMDGRVDSRMYFASALPGVPPLIDLATARAISGLYNNGRSGSAGVSGSARRYFEPYLIDLDHHGANDRAIHDGWQLNGGGDTTPGNGGISDPLWAGRANPAWSPDGTTIVYWQAQVVAPACGPGSTSVPTCPASHEPGGRHTRLMIAELTSRTPESVPQPQPISDDIPWGTPYHPGDPAPALTPLPAGTYTLEGKKGSAHVVIALNAAKTDVASVQVTYADYSSDGVNMVNGTETGLNTPFTWHEDLTLSGLHHGTRKTSEPGGFVVTAPPQIGEPFTIAGTLITTLDGQTYTSPTTGN